jgi:hypothetical protein
VSNDSSLSIARAETKAVHRSMFIFFVGDRDCVDCLWCSHIFFHEKRRGR